MKYNIQIGASDMKNVNIDIKWKQYLYLGRFSGAQYFQVCAASPAH